jgi:hypothetical protein
MAVSRAVVTGILDQSQMEQDLLEHLDPIIQSYRR